jgi:hypothetical protein
LLKNNQSWYDNERTVPTVKTEDMVKVEPEPEYDDDCVIFEVDVKSIFCKPEVLDEGPNWSSLSDRLLFEEQNKDYRVPVGAEVEAYHGNFKIILPQMLEHSCEREVGADEADVQPVVKVDSDNVQPVVEVDDVQPVSDEDKVTIRNESFMNE